jgi:hypothetical protein
MADKSFGVKNVDLISSSGTPTIDSPNNININAINVAISTDATIGGDLTVTGDIVGIASTSSATIVKGNSEISDPSGSGNSICMVPTGHSPGTATTIYRDTGIRFRDSDTTLLISDGNPGSGQINVGGIATVGTLSATLVESDFFETPKTRFGNGADRGFTLKYYITSNSSSSYRFSGPGLLGTEDNPTLYFHRGFTYILENSTGSNHPFELRLSDGGSAYAPGGSFLAGSTTGTQTLTVPMNAPSSIVYQCTIHSGMLGTINFVS